MKLDQIALATSLIVGCGAPVAPLASGIQASLEAAALPTAFSTEQAVERVVALLGEQAAGGRISRENAPLRFRPSANNSVEWLREGVPFERQIADIGRARRFVVAHNFILSDQVTGQRMSGALIGAARRGARVAITYDTFGTTAYADGAKRITEDMRRAGIDVVANSLLKLDRMEHQKIVIVDGSEGPIYYTGGQGWDDKYSGWGGVQAWNDGAFRVRGDAAVQQLTFELWQLAERGVRLAPGTSDRGTAKKYIRDVYFGATRSGPGRTEVTVLNNLTWENRPVSDALYRLIDDPGVREIRVAMPYITDPVAIEKLRNAVRRGASIRVLMPGLSDALPSQLVTEDHARSWAREAAKLGNGATVAIGKWRTPEQGPAMAHQKFLIFVRGRAANGRVLNGTVVGGSHNLTAVEGRSGEENNDILVNDAAFAMQMELLFNQQFAQAEALRLDGGLGGAANSGVAKIIGTILRPFM